MLFRNTIFINTKKGEKMKNTNKTKVIFLLAFLFIFVTGCSSNESNQEMFIGSVDDTSDFNIESGESDEETREYQEQENYDDYMYDDYVYDDYVDDDYTYDENEIYEEFYPEEFNEEYLDEIITQEFGFQELDEELIDLGELI